PPSPIHRMRRARRAVFIHPCVCEVWSMTERARAQALAQRQQRVAKVVWGSLFIVMGVLFTLQDMGRIDLGQPPHDFEASRAVDGDRDTRWSSAFADPQWLTVDLAAVLPLSRIRLSWEEAYAKEYALELSSDGTSWTTARRVKDGQGGIDEQELQA